MATIEKSLTKAKQMLQKLDSGSDACKYYGNGFLDGLKFGYEQAESHIYMLTDFKITEIYQVRMFSEFVVRKYNLRCIHPDVNFNGYCNPINNKKIFTEKQAERLNILMKQCVKVCGKENVDILEVLGMKEYFSGQKPFPNDFI